MPGSRLNHEDRRLVASGLADGLGYAEIARRLGRPTSTISREVARNGGRERYRADHAHLATGWRARRRESALGPELFEEPDQGRDPQAVREFVERFAALMVETGVPRMAARVLACLFTTDSHTRTAADLVRRLRVSPASISKAIGYLEGLGMVRREREPGTRHEQYVVDEDVWYGSWTASTQKNVMWADAAREGVAILGARTPAGARLEQMGQFFGRLGAVMDLGPDISPAAADDAATVLAALVHAGTPLTAERLSTGLGWPCDRVDEALRMAEAHPGITDPIVLRRVKDGYTFAAWPDRLTRTQRRAIRSCVPHQ